MRVLSESHDFKVEFRLINKTTFDRMVARVGDSKSQDDVAVQLITPTCKRSLAAFLTASPVDSNLVYIMRADRDGLPFPWAIYDVFALPKWSVVLGIMFGFSQVLVLIDFSNEEPARVDAIRRRSRHIWRFWDHLYNLRCLLLGHSNGTVPDDTPRRLIVIIFKAFAFGLGALYTALLVTILNPVNPRFTTAALCSGSAPVPIDRLAIAAETSIASYISDFLADPRNNCGDKECIKSTSSAECVQIVEDGRVDATLDDSQITDFQLATSKCDKLEVRGETGNSQGTTWVLPQRPESQEIVFGLSNAILLARMDGTFNTLTGSYTRRGTCNPRDTEQVRPLQLIELFISLGTMFLLALIIQVVRLICQNTPLRKRVFTGYQHRAGFQDGEKRSPVDIEYDSSGYTQTCSNPRLGSTGPAPDGGTYKLATRQLVFKHVPID